MNLNVFKPMSPLDGRLHTYSTRYGALTIFESGDCSSSSCLLFIAGLTEVCPFIRGFPANLEKGYMGTPYIHKLSSQLQDINWSCCQLNMRSSYMGFGTGSLERDFEDISEAIAYLITVGKNRVILMGHSSGSQNSIHYVLNRLRKSAPSVSGVIVFEPPSVFLCD
jgi:Protein of unknown function (DUF1749)